MKLKNSKSLGEYLVAGTAFCVSVCTLALYFYQSRIMAEQQHTAVWPYVEWYTSNVEDFRLTAQNKGVGPAIVRKVTLTVGGKTVNGNRGLVHAVLGPDNALGWQNSSLEGRVLTPGEAVHFFIIPDRAAGLQFQQKLQQLGYSLEITYCSVYGKCWISKGLISTRTADQAIDTF